MRAALLTALLCLMACVPQPPEVAELPVVMETPEGYPWKMGEGRVTLDGATRPYTTFDFSIGALDAAVQFRKDYDCSGQGPCEDTGKFALALGAHPDADPDAEASVLRVMGLFDVLPEGPATTRNVTVEISDAEGRDNHSLMSSGTAELVLTAVRRGRDGSDRYGTLSARVTATVCDARDDMLIAGGVCHDVTATFTTEVQYDSV